MYLANPAAGDVLDAMRRGDIGLIDTPRQGGIRVKEAHAAGVPWCADNGCFSAAWDETHWWKWLNHPDQLDHRDTCLFAVAPDVVGDAWRSHLRSYPWLARIRSLGYPVAYVFQNRADRHPIPWHDFDVAFIGGCAECPVHGPRPSADRVGRGGNLRYLCDVCAQVIPDWKLDPIARQLAHDAKARGKWVHVGRVNSGKRWRYTTGLPEHGGMGADSVDGTFLAGRAKNLPRLLSWAHRDNTLC